MDRHRLPRAFRWRSAAFGALLLGVLIALGVQLVRIHVFGHEKSVLAAQAQNYAVRRMPALRGRIQDAAGAVLAMSLPAQTVCADLGAIKDPRQAAEALAPILDMDAGELERKLSDKPRRGWIYIDRRVEPETADRIQRLRIPGIVFEQEGRRLYPLHELAANILGFAGADDVGLEGIEKAMDAFLRGEAGFVRVRKDATGRPLVLEDGDELSRLPSPGLTVHLTLDSTIQLVAEQELKRAADKYRPKGATIAVMDVNTGAILAMACLPTYDPQEPGKAHAASRRNRVVTDVYEPGSTNKSFIAAAAIDRKTVSPGTPIFCENGSWRVGYRTLHDVHAYGTLTMFDVIVKSSNIGAAKIGLTLGIEGVFDAERRFGFGEPTGIELPGEMKGLLRPKRVWKKDSVLSVSMGQEVAVTPLQLLRAYAAMVNGGLLLRPRILSHVTDEDDNVVRRTETEVLRRAVSRETSDTMRKILVEVVERGTGKDAKCNEYRIGGKTGTAQKVVGGTFSHDLYVGSFCGFAPADNPRLVCLATLDEPDRSIGYYGGTVAAPPVREVLKRSLMYLGVPPRPSEKKDARLSSAEH